MRSLPASRGGEFSQESLSNHPDPMLERPEWVSLNGWWEYAVVPGSGMCPTAAQWAPLRVPFAIETTASGVNRPLLPHERLHYRRTVTIPQAWHGKRLRIVLSAVDHDCEVLVNGRVLARHVGGYLPFDVTIGPLKSDTFELSLKVTDPTDTRPIQRGKQSLRPRTIWYTATSGIWGDVWMEPLPETAITSLRVEPLPDLSGFRVLTQVEGATSQTVQVEVQPPSGKPLRATGTTGTWLDVPVTHPQRWSPSCPNMYQLTVRAGDDQVRTWSALRSIRLSPKAPGRAKPSAPGGRRERGAAHPGRRILLNGQPILVNAPLWQGYWPESGMTPPSDKALLHDLQLLKRMGFNAVRVHVKVESRRFYHLCDRLGLMVVQDMVSGGRPPLGIKASGLIQALGYTLPDRSRLFRRWTARGQATNRRDFALELAQMVRHLRCHPSVIMWVAFNEGWGQFDAAGAAKAIRCLDPTRLIDAASGWFDQGVGDVRSRHRYMLRLKPPPRGDTRAFYLSEFGGLNLAVPAHTWTRSPAFGYRFLPDAHALAHAMEELYRHELIPLARQGLAACTYTQVCDVERESNGLLTYDRAVTKIDPDLMARLNKELEAAFNAHR